MMRKTLMGLVTLAVLALALILCLDPPSAVAQSLPVHGGGGAGPAGPTGPTGANGLSSIRYPNDGGSSVYVNYLDGGTSTCRFFTDGAGTGYIICDFGYFGAGVMNTLIPRDADLITEIGNFTAKDIRASARLIADGGGDFGGRKIINVGAGVNPGDAVNMSQIGGAGVSYESVCGYHKSSAENNTTTRYRIPSFPDGGAPTTAVVYVNLQVTNAATSGVFPDAGWDFQIVDTFDATECTCHYECTTLASSVCTCAGATFIPDDPLDMGMANNTCTVGGAGEPEFNICVQFRH